jgi:hypothetical protein
VTERDAMWGTNDPGFTNREMDQMLVYYGTRKQRRDAKTRIGERERQGAVRHQPVEPQDLRPQELQETRATELGAQQERPRRRFLRRRSST